MGALESDLASIAGQLAVFRAETAGLPDRVKALEIQRSECCVPVQARQQEVLRALDALDRRVVDLERLHVEAVKAADRAATDAKASATATAAAIEKAGERRWTGWQMVINAVLAALTGWILFKMGVKP